MKDWTVADVLEEMAREERRGHGRAVSVDDLLNRSDRRMESLFDVLREMVGNGMAVEANGEPTSELNSDCFVGFPETDSGEVSWDLLRKMANDEGGGLE